MDYIYPVHRSGRYVVPNFSHPNKLASENFIVLHCYHVEMKRGVHLQDIVVALALLRDHYSCEVTRVSMCLTYLLLVFNTIGSTASTLSSSRAPQSRRYPSTQLSTQPVIFPLLLATYLPRGSVQCTSGMKSSTPGHISASPKSI